MTYQIAYGRHIDWKSFRRLSSTDKERIRQMIEYKLTMAPTHFGKPLQTPLFPYWSLRVGEYRVIYWIEKKTVHIELIGHRSTIYPDAEKLLGHS